MAKFDQGVVNCRVIMNPSHGDYDRYYGQHKGQPGVILEESRSSELNVQIQWENGHTNSYRLDSLIFIDSEGKETAPKYSFKKGYTVIMNPEHPNCENYMDQHCGDLGVVLTDYVGTPNTYIVVRWFNGYENNYLADCLTIVSTDIHESVRAQVEAEKKEQEKYKYPLFPGTKVKIIKPESISSKYLDTEAYIGDIILTESNLKSWNTISLRSIKRDVTLAIVLNDGKTARINYYEIEPILEEGIKDCCIYTFENGKVMYAIDGDTKAVDLYAIRQRNDLSSKKLYNAEWRKSITDAIDSSPSRVL
jgi:hypothetical protein